MILDIDRLDIMVAYSCNISCKGCISLSDRRRSGVEPKNNIKAWLDAWKSKIRPKLSTIFGGEPTLNPDLIDICRDVRNAWPGTVLRLITNGYLLDRFEPSAWFELGRLEIQVSIHRKDHEPEINQNLKNILLQRRPWVVKKHGGIGVHQQISWTHDSGIKIYKSMFSDFVIPYQDVQGMILPWNSDPALAHSICGAGATPILFKGKLYKCPAVANVLDLIGPDSWCDYQAVDITSDLDYFVSHIGKPEKCCAQCPDLPRAQIINHLDKVNVKIKNRD